MTNSIIENIGNPAALEIMYRKDAAQFTLDFDAVYESIKDEPVARVWHERLHYVQPGVNWGNKNELWMVICVAAVASIVALVPNFIKIEEDVYYSRNIGLILFGALMAYFIFKQKQVLSSIIIPVVITVASMVYMNLLPNLPKSDSIVQAAIHMPLLLWVVFGYVFMNGGFTKSNSRISFLRFNGDFMVMSGLMLIAGGLFCAITIGLFSLIGVRIENYFQDYIVPVGLSSVPVVAAFLVQNNNQLVSKISPVIARIFTPIVFVTLFIFIATVIITGNYPNSNRDFLMLFNVLLVAVMALILFSLTEITKSSDQKMNQWLLLGLSVLTIVVNIIALSSISYRISSYGFSPNRLSVLGADLLILFNLILVSHKLFLIVRGKVGVEEVEQSIAMFLPVYFIWTAFVAFGFPILFKMM
jgi:hypothetical protein